MTVRVALGQVDCVSGDINANLERLVGTARRARDAGAQLLVFPEMSLSGYFLGDAMFDLALRLDDPRLEPLLDISRTLSLVVGAPIEEPGPRFSNAALFLEGGEVRHVHRKVYLPTYGAFNEVRLFSPGQGMAAFDSRLGRMAMLICEDLWHPALAYLAVQDGAEYLLALIASPVGGVDKAFATRLGYQALHRSYATTFTCFVVACNRVGEEAGLQFWGGSEVIGPDGVPLTEAEGMEEELLLADLDSDALRRQRIKLPTLRDERPELVLRELGRIIRSRERAQ